MPLSKIDRSLQHSILTILATSYPDILNSECLDQLVALTNETTLYANLLYLENHGLVTSGLFRLLDGELAWNQAKTQITHHGIDFLKADGGLTAILRTLTIKLHEDSLRELITLRISSSPLPPADKPKLLARLRSLPDETIKHLTLKLVDAGLANWPAALQAIETFLPR